MSWPSSSLCVLLSAPSFMSSSAASRDMGRESWLPCSSESVSSSWSSMSIVIVSTASLVSLLVVIRDLYRTPSYDLGALLKMSPQILFLKTFFTLSSDGEKSISEFRPSRSSSASSSFPSLFRFRISGSSFPPLSLDPDVSSSSAYRARKSLSVAARFSRDPRNR